MKARMWAFYIYAADGRRVGLEAWLGKESANVEKAKWDNRGYATGRLFRQ